MMSDSTEAKGEVSGPREQIAPQSGGLRPCPLCQGEVIGIDHPPHTHVFATFMPDHPGSYSIECPRCNLGLLADTEELAKAAWNSRVALRVEVPTGECLWLIETSTLAVKSDPTYPQRHYWDGRGWDFRPLKAARYTSKEYAEHVREEQKMYPLDEYPVCEHMFQCGTEGQAPRTDAIAASYIWDDPWNGIVTSQLRERIDAIFSHARQLERELANCEAARDIAMQQSAKDAARTTEATE